MLGLLLVAWAAQRLPSLDCNARVGVSPHGREDTLVYLTGFATLAVGAAAFVHLALLRERYPRATAALAVFLLGSALIGALLAWLGLIDVGVVFIYFVTLGGLAAAFSFLALLATWFLGWGLEEVGVLVPVYLLGMATVYPTFALIVLFAHSLGCD